MQSKGFLLQLARRMLVEIIEAGLANADNFGMRGQFDELCRRYFIALTFRLMRMNTDGAMNIVILLRDRPDSVKLAEFPNYCGGLLAHAFYIQKQVKDNLFTIKVDDVCPFYQVIPAFPNFNPVSGRMPGNHFFHDVRFSGNQIAVTEIIAGGADQTGQPPGVKLADCAIACLPG